MMRQPFDENGRFVARKPLFLDDVTSFRAGEPFPWKALGLTLRDLRVLWSAFKVDCLPAPQPAVEAK